MNNQQSDNRKRFEKILKIIKWLETQTYDDGDHVAYSTAGIRKQFPQYTTDQIKAFMEEAAESGLIKRGGKGRKMYSFDRDALMRLQLDQLVKQGQLEKIGDGYSLTVMGSAWVKHQLNTNPDARDFMERLGRASRK